MEANPTESIWYREMPIGRLVYFHPNKLGYFSMYIFHSFYSYGIVIKDNAFLFNLCDG